jgi:hypothetical protein
MSLERLRGLLHVTHQTIQEQRWDACYNAYDGKRDTEILEAISS